MTKEDIGKKLLLNRTDNTVIQFFRYGLAGGVAFVVDFSLLYVLTEFLHIHYLISAALSFIPGVTVNYCLSILWVFNRRVLKKRSAEFVFFILIAIGGLLLNEFFMWFFTEIVGCHYLLSKVISVGLGYIWNFSAKKFFLFR